MLIYDIVPISVEQVVAGKVHSVEEWLEYVGKGHLDHRLERKPGSRQASVARIFLLTMCLGLSAVAPRHAGMFEATVLLLQACLVVATVAVAELRGCRQ